MKINKIEETENKQDGSRFLLELVSEKKEEKFVSSLFCRTYNWRERHKFSIPQNMCTCLLEPTASATPPTSSGREMWTCTWWCLSKTWESGSSTSSITWSM